MYAKVRLSVIMTLWLLERQTTGAVLCSMSSAQIARRVVNLAGVNHDIDYTRATSEAMRRRSPFTLESLIKTKVTDRQVRRGWIPILRSKPSGLPLENHLMNEFIKTCALRKKDTL